MKSKTLTEQLNLIGHSIKSKSLLEKLREQEAKEKTFLDSCSYTNFMIDNPLSSKDNTTEIQSQHSKETLC